MGIRQLMQLNMALVLLEQATSDSLDATDSAVTTRA